MDLYSPHWGHILASFQQVSCVLTHMHSSERPSWFWTITCIYDTSPTIHRDSTVTPRCTSTFMWSSSIQSPKINFNTRIKWGHIERPVSTFQVHWTLGEIWDTCRKLIQTPVKHADSKHSLGSRLWTSCCEATEVATEPPAACTI